MLTLLLLAAIPLPVPLDTLTVERARGLDGAAS
jgi:hypothetical protein